MTGDIFFTVRAAVPADRTAVQEGDLEGDLGGRPGPVGERRPSGLPISSEPSSRSAHGSKEGSSKAPRCARREGDGSRGRGRGREEG